jgi:hypothetical protein
VPLALDKRLTCFSLCMQRIEILFESFFRGLADVDRAAQRLMLVGAHFVDRPVLGRVPKNSGPDHWVPVILRAMTERLV